MPTYRIRLVCERGPEPITGEVLDHGEETIEVEAPDPWKAYRKATALMSISPNGRLLSGYDADTGELIRPPDTSSESFRHSRFEIADVQGPYEGFTRGESWNGWAVPYFEREAALRIAEDYGRVAKEQGGDMADARARYDDEAEAFLFYDPIYDDEVAYEAFTISVDGEEVTVYPVGTREWTWEEVRAQGGAAGAS